MGKDSGIQWTHHTFNPWWGCVRVSPGCENCYAEAFDRRVGGDHWGRTAERRFFGDKHWQEPLKWNRAAVAAGERHRVFCASMADVFETPPGEMGVRLAVERMRLWALIRATPALDWLLLTKRPENIAALLPIDWRNGYANVWLGCTVEDQKRLDERLPHLTAVRARVLFLSCEPLLSDLAFGGWMPDKPDDPADCRSAIDWVIVGGESGPGARLSDCAHMRRVVEQCERAGVAVFCKQLGRSVLDSDYGLAPLRLKDKTHGGDIDEFPEDLRVRQFPEMRRAVEGLR